MGENFSFSTLEVSRPPFLMKVLPWNSGGASMSKMTRIPHMHKASHHVKFLASRYGTNVVFSWRYRLGSLYKVVNYTNVFHCVITRTLQ